MLSACISTPPQVTVKKLVFGGILYSDENELVITANLRDRDIGSYVAEAQQRIQQEVNIPAGYWVNWGGGYI